MRTLLANIAVVLATLATLAFLVPQIVKLVRTGNSAGVSTTWPAIGFATNVGWFTYFINQQLWWSLAAPFGAFVGYGVTIWALARIGRPIRASLVRGVVVGLLLAITPVIWDWTTLGVVLGLAFGGMMVPTLWTAFRTPDPSGIAPGTWWVGVAESGLWGFYGWHHADPGVITFSVTAAIGASLMLGRYYATRPRSVAG